MRAYRIKNWDKIFENSESRKLRKLNWVPIPNSWEGLGYVRVTKHKNAVSILAAWPLVIQIGSKCPYRGLLAKVDAPLSVEDMSDLTRMPAQMFERALEALMDPLIGWVDEVEIEKSEDDESWKILGVPNESPETPGESPDASGDGGVEQNRTERKGREQKLAGGEASGSDFDQFWKAYPRRIAPNEARKAWNKIKNRPDLSVVLAAIEKQKATKDWQKENGKYIPYPATWLNQGRWADEVEIQSLAPQSQFATW